MGFRFLDCTFSDNAVAYGGGVRLSGTSGDQATISGCSFTNHVSPVSELGSALNSNSIDLTLVDCEFVGNRASTSVFVAHGASYDIDRCHFENNFDGTCASFSGDVDVSMSQCIFIDNSSSGVSIGGFSTASFSECLFENNHATWGPGGILMTQTDTIIDSCEFRGKWTGIGVWLWRDLSLPRHVGDCGHSLLREQWRCGRYRWPMGMTVAGMNLTSSVHPIASAISMAMVG